METLRAREDECVATLDRERMALEMVFRDGDRDELIWIILQGTDGGPLGWE